MSETSVDGNKRRFLIAASSVMGGVAAVVVAVPFVMSMTPSQRARAAGAPVEVDISKVEPGMKLDVEWRGKVVWVVNRTQEMLGSLPKLNDQLADPKSENSIQQKNCQNEARSIKPNLLVLEGICTHLGCSPTFRKDVAPPDLGPAWLGGFFCPCHGSKFDLAGRVYKSVPAPANLPVPPHKYVADTRLLIGEEQQGA